MDEDSTSEYRSKPVDAQPPATAFDEVNPQTHADATRTEKKGINLVFGSLIRLALFAVLTGATIVLLTALFGLFRGG